MKSINIEARLSSRGKAMIYNVNFLIYMKKAIRDLYFQIFYHIFYIIYLCIISSTFLVKLINIIRIQIFVVPFNSINYLKSNSAQCEIYISNGHFNNCRTIIHRTFLTHLLNRSKEKMLTLLTLSNYFLCIFHSSRSYKPHQHVLP